MLRLLVVAAISLAPLATAATPCTMGAPADPAPALHAHGGVHLAGDMGHSAHLGGETASEGSAGAAPIDGDTGHTTSGACADECAAHFQVPIVGSTRPASMNTARAAMAPAAAPSAPAAAIEHVPLS